MSGKPRRHGSCKLQCDPNDGILYYKEPKSRPSYDPTVLNIDDTLGPKDLLLGILEPLKALQGLPFGYLGS